MSSPYKHLICGYYNYLVGLRINVSSQAPRNIVFFILNFCFLTSKDPNLYRPLQPIKCIKGFQKDYL